MCPWRSSKFKYTQAHSFAQDELSIIHGDSQPESRNRGNHT